jgi:hypothetical protein
VGYLLLHRLQTGGQQLAVHPTVVVIVVVVLLLLLLQQQRLPVHLHTAFDAQRLPNISHITHRQVVAKQGPGFCIIVEMNGKCGVMQIAFCVLCLYQFSQLQILHQREGRFCGTKFASNFFLGCCGFSRLSCVGL